MMPPPQPDPFDSIPDLIRNLLTTQDPFLGAEIHYTEGKAIAMPDGSTQPNAKLTVFVIRDPLMVQFCGHVIQGAHSLVAEIMKRHAAPPEEEGS